MQPVPPYNETELMLRISEGDEASFTLLYHHYVPQLSAFLQRLTHSPAIADELVQETFLQIWINRDKLPSVEQPRAWIFRIAANITYNFLKRRITERNILEKMSSGIPMYQPSMVEESLHLRQLKESIKEAVNGLTPQRKKIYQLSREGGMSIPEIAERLGLSPNTVKNTLVTALQQIRDFLSNKGFFICWIILALLFFKKI